MVFVSDVGENPNDHVLVAAEHEGNEDKENCLQTIFHNCNRSTDSPAVEFPFQKISNSS